MINAPSGTTPCAPYRHRAISSLRESATIPTRRIRPVPSAKRVAYHFAKALWGWKRNHLHANSVIKCRTRAFPALLIPCSRWLSPLE